MSFTGRVYTGSANRGVDRRITIRRNDTGDAIALGGRMASIEWEDNDSVEIIDGIDNGGKETPQRHPGHVSGRITVNRFSGDFEGFMKFMNANFYAGQPDVKATIIATTTNQGPDVGGPSTDVDTFTQVVFHKLKSGPFENKKNPKVTFEFAAEERV